MGGFKINVRPRTVSTSGFSSIKPCDDITWDTILFGDILYAIGRTATKINKTTRVIRLTAEILCFQKLSGCQGSGSPLISASYPDNNPWIVSSS